MALTVSGALRTAGIDIGADDRVIPPQGSLVWDLAEIRVETARNVLVKTPDDEISLFSPERIPANLIREAGIALYPHDRVMLNGRNIDPDLPLERNDSLLLQYIPASRLNLSIDDQELTIYSSEATLGAALETASILVAPHDRVSEDLLTPITGDMDVAIRRARSVTVRTADTSVTGLTAAVTVGEALLDVGIPLQNLDYTLPGEDAPIPEDGEIDVVRVNEELVIMTDEVPYENEYVEDPETLLDQVSVVEPGQVGIYATRDRIKYANGEEIWRDNQDSWQASETEDGVLGYGTKVEIRTEVVDGQEIEYWRKIYVWATAYSPCRSGVDRCLYGTATGIMPVQKGVVAVTPRWLSVPNGYGMWGQSVYIPGYGRGVIADTGGGIPGTPWIDLAYSDEDYQSWNRWTVMYFLPPVPPWFPPIIYP
jgi:uncharacterized protein YabE (DUF348 family)